VHCQSNRERELISRPELRQTDRHAHEVKADATETAVTGHLRPTGRRWPVTTISVSAAFAESARRNSGREGERTISADSVLFSGSVTKACAKVLRSHAHSPAPFQAFSGGYLQAGSLAACTARRQMTQCREAYSNCLQSTCYGCVACSQEAYRRNICEFECSFRSR